MLHSLNEASSLCYQWKRKADSCHGGRMASLNPGTWKILVAHLPPSFSKLLYTMTTVLFDSSLKQLSNQIIIWSQSLIALDRTNSARLSKILKKQLKGMCLNGNRNVPKTHSTFLIRNVYKWKYKCQKTLLFKQCTSTREEEKGGKLEQQHICLVGYHIMFLWNIFKKN